MEKGFSEADKIIEYTFRRETNSPAEWSRPFVSHNGGEIFLIYGCITRISPSGFW